MDYYLGERLLSKKMSNGLTTFVLPKKITIKFSPYILHDTVLLTANLWCLIRRASKSPGRDSSFSRTQDV